MVVRIKHSSTKLHSSWHALWRSEPRESSITATTRAASSPAQHHGPHPLHGKLLQSCHVGSTKVSSPPLFVAVGRSTCSVVHGAPHSRGARRHASRLCSKVAERSRRPPNLRGLPWQDGSVHSLAAGRQSGALRKHQRVQRHSPPGSSEILRDGRTCATPVPRQRHRCGLLHFRTTSKCF